jgi:hypothetical protein
MKKTLLTLAIFAMGCAAFAGAVGGPKEAKQRRCNANSSVTYEVAFRGGEQARVVVDGDGDTDLDLYIYDENGNLITKDDDNTDYCICTWTPKWTGKFTIRIVNRGNVYNEYTLRTN